MRWLPIAAMVLGLCASSGGGGRQGIALVLSPVFKRCDDSCVQRRYRVRCLIGRREGRRQRKARCRQRRPNRFEPLLLAYALRLEIVRAKTQMYCRRTLRVGR